MRTLCLALLAFVFVGCHTAHLGNAGGDGSSLEHAAIITGAQDEEAAGTAPLGHAAKDGPALEPAVTITDAPDEETVGAAHLRYAGGDGSSMRHAVIILGARDEEAVSAAERAWMEQRYPGFRKGLQSLLSSGGKHYDEIKITAREGRKTVYFDITDFFGK